jgi:hypothetical protein
VLASEDHDDSGTFRSRALQRRLRCGAVARLHAARRAADAAARCRFATFGHNAMPLAAASFVTGAAACRYGGRIPCA